jgi:glycosyltransferase involved in cell wall biosynthesis
MVINQWLPAAHAGDAVGDSARQVRSILRRLGHRSEIYAVRIDEALRGEVQPFADPCAARGDLTILHFGLASPMTEAFAALPSGRVLQYHNITPARFFARFDAGLTRLAIEGRRELAALARRVELALGVSEYNRRELEALGFPRTAVLPIAVAFDRLVDAPAVPALERALDDGVANVLFVGRIVPNKCIEDYVRLATRYDREVGGEFRFVFVGRTDVLPRYYSAVRSLIARSGVPGARFLFAGAVSDRELAAYYRHASVYLSLSEHEGFCVPLLESMAMDVPVMALGAAAVPETLGGAGIEFNTKDFSHVAQLLALVLHDDDLVERVVDGQRRRVADFRDEAMARRLAEIVELGTS